MQPIQMKGKAVATDRAEIDRNLALLDEVLLRLAPLVPTEELTKRVGKVLQVVQEHSDLTAGKGVQI